MAHLPALTPGTVRRIAEGSSSIGPATLQVIGELWLLLLMTLMRSFYDLLWGNQARAIAQKADQALLWQASRTSAQVKKENQGTALR